MKENISGRKYYRKKVLFDGRFYKKLISFMIIMIFVIVTAPENIQAKDSVAINGYSDTLLVRRGNQYLFKYDLSTGVADYVVTYGNAEDDILIGDWDGDGFDSLAVRRGNTYYIKNDFSSGDSEDVFVYGKSDDNVLVGDWDGDGIDTLAVRRGNAYYIKNDLSTGNADCVFLYGKADDEVLVGDWDGDNVDTLCVKRENVYYFKKGFNSEESADEIISYGNENDIILTGDWDGNGTDTFCVRCGNEYSIYNDFSGNDAEIIFVYGNATDEVYIGNWLIIDDSDGDGLIDLDEELLGTDLFNPDTDEDGLSDYDEMVLGTDPLTPNDYDENIDSDNDGLTDIEETKLYGTNPFLNDTDIDGLSDYDEICTCDTNPLESDTDGDTLSDGFEIEHGLNPNQVSSDGVLEDSERLIEQTISETGISKSLSADNNVARPSVSGISYGELSDNVFLASDTDSAFDDVRAVVGEVVYVDGNDEYIDGLSLDFNLDSYEGDKNDLVVVTLKEDGTFEVVQTTLTETVLSCQLKNSGTYCVLNLEEFLESLGFDLSPYYSESSIVFKDSLESENVFEYDTGEVEKNGISANETSRMHDSVDETSDLSSNDDIVYNVELVSDIDNSQVDSDILDQAEIALMSSSANGQADIVFVVDTTGSMKTDINNVVTNITSFTTTLSENYNVTVNYALVDYKDLETDGSDSTIVVQNMSSNWYSDPDDFIDKISSLTVSGGGDIPECAVDALETARNLDFRTSACKYIILITDASYKTTNRYGVDSMNEEIELLADDEIITSVVTTSVYQNTYQSLYESTGGIYADIESDSFSSELLKLADLIGETTIDGSWVLLQHGFRFVKLTNETDQDGDGLSTAYELGTELEIDISSLIETQLFLHGIPYEDYTGDTIVKVYDARSDPTNSDTDNDGIMDGDSHGHILDDAPWKKGYADGSIGEIYLVVCNGSNISELVSGNEIYGHAFLLYKSYVNDIWDLSDWNSGYMSIDGSWKGVVRTSPVSAYELNVNDVFSFSAGGENYDDAQCAVYNMEFYKYVNIGMTYEDNQYFERIVTQSELDKMMNQMSEEAMQNYYIPGVDKTETVSAHYYVCTTVSLNVWKTMYDENIDPVGLNTPRNVYLWMKRHGSSSGLKLSNYINVD